MNKWIVLGLLLISGFLTSCSSVNSVEPFDDVQAAKLIQSNYVSYPAQERISLLLPNKYSWKPIDLSRMNKGVPIMLIPIDEDENNWMQSFRTSIAAYQQNPGITADKFVKNEFALAKTKCAEVTGTILKQSTQYTIYKIDQCGCPEERDLIKIGKAFNGRDAVYVVYYSVVPGSTSKQQIANMTEVIYSASLVTT